MTLKLFAEKETPMGWIIAAVGLLGGAALAFGFNTPGSRIAVVEKKVEDHTAAISGHDSKITGMDQKLDDIKEVVNRIENKLTR